MEFVSSLAEPQPFSSPELAGTLTLCISAILVALYFLVGKHTKRMPPEPKGALPIIGHLHLLPTKVPLFRTLQDIADQIGPVFTIKLGTKRTLVVSSWEAAKDIFVTHDRIFLTRPGTAAAKYMGYNYALFPLSPYGPYWQAVRKFTITHLLSTSRLEQLKPLRSAELSTSMNHLFSLSRAGPVDMSEWFSQLAMNYMTLLVAGKRYGNGDPSNDEARRFVKAMEEFFYLLGMFVLSDSVPFTEWLDFQGRIEAMKRVAKELDCLMSRWVEEHGRERKGEKEGDFLDIMLSELGEEDSFQYQNQDVVKATVLGLILAGVDTTYNTLTWTLSLLLNHPKVMEKAQEELDIHVGRKRWVDYSDIPNLTYLVAIIKETLRMYPAGPLSVPREALEDCTVAGYHVPKGTRLLVNIWKLHHDPKIWSDPYEFQPERFLTTHAKYDVRGKTIEFIPFSVGRRSCPGISLATQVLYLTIARVLQGFNMHIPGNQKVDMSEGLGITLPKAMRLQVVLTPRLSFDLYDL